MLDKTISPQRIKDVVDMVGLQHRVVVFLGLYNPYEQLSSAEDNRLLNTWNYNTQQLVEEDGKGIFIPTYDLMKYNLGRYLSKDGLHPNSAGYQALSNRISKSVETIITGS